MNERGNAYAIAALRDKRACIASEIKHLQSSLRHKNEQLVHVDACLAILDPDRDPSEIPNKRRPKHINLFRSGELSGLIMTVFRESDGEALATAEITQRIMQAQGLGHEAHKAISSRVRTNLSYQVKRGRVLKLGDGRDARWQLVNK